MNALMIGDAEFLIPGDPTPAVSSTWWGLGSYSQNVLRWAARQPETGTAAYSSDLVGLRSLARQGYVVETGHGWTATAAGRRLVAGATS